MPGVFDTLDHSLRAIPGQLGVTPTAILMVTAHWIEREFAVSAHPQPPMIYDFGGFPEHTYHVKYSAPGSPLLAGRVQALLQGAGLPVHLDPARGFDHGTYAPLAPMYPDANVPVVQLSIHRRFDPETHLQVGRALAPLRKEGVLILGSGLSFHNLGIFGPEGAEPSKAFDRWIQETLAASPAERWSRLTQWSAAPSARKAHPREDHLLPLMVAVGAAENEPANIIYHEEAFMGSWTLSGFRFGTVESGG
jgi:aromatic ring-opening dioxygenase catalytic subunit (LigB family)